MQRSVCGGGGKDYNTRRTAWVLRCGESSSKVPCRRDSLHVSAACACACPTHPLWPCQRDDGIFWESLFLPRAPSASKTHGDQLSVLLCCAETLSVGHLKYKSQCAVPPLHS